MKLPRVVLWFSVLAFAGFGLAFSLAPEFMAGLVDVQLPTATARIDFAATYGGFALGLAAFLAFCTRRDVRVRLGLVASGLCLLGFALTRAIGIVVARGEVRPILFAVLATEVAGVALCFWAARRAATDPRS